MLRTALSLLKQSSPSVQRLTFSASTSDRDSNKEVPTMPEGVACCGSGCQNCVWLVHAEQILEFYGNNYAGSNEGIAKALAEIEKLEDENLKSFLRMELRMKIK